MIGRRLKYTLWLLLLAVTLLAVGVGVNYWHYHQLTAPYVGFNAAGELVLRGQLTPQLLQQFTTFEQSHDLRHRRLRVKSPGGLTMVGMRIGVLVHKLQMDVEVDEFCVSSCANFIFTAARKKYVRHNSGLIFHGGSLQENMEEKRADKSLWGETRHEASVVPLSVADQQLLRELLPAPPKGQAPKLEREQEMDFFRYLGVNPLITIYGQLGSYQQAYETTHHIGFHYTIADLEKFGVTEVHFLGEGVWRPHTNPYDGSPYWVKVDEEILRDYSRRYGLE
ncbi:MAG TPA: hypothetical protein VIC08_14965 [Cellvibrionaceae bacterium]